MGAIEFCHRLIIVSSIYLVNPTIANIYQNYQYYYRNPPQKTSYFLPSQKYVAIPGRIVQHYKEYPQYPTTSLIQAPLQRLTVPPRQRLTIPLRQRLVPLFPPRFRIESDSESSSPPPEDSGEDNNQQAQPGMEQPGMPGIDAGDTQQPPPQEPPPSQPPPGEEQPPLPEEEQPPPPPPPMEDPHQDHEHSKVIHKHISIHVPPEEMEDEEVTIIRPKLPQPDKLVNIVFIKAPTHKKKKFEVLLPDKPEQKTLIYVLVKKSEPQDTIKVRGPPPTQPPKPKVFFIKYKHNKEESPSYNIFAAKKHSSYHY